MLSEEHRYAIALRKCSLIGDLNFKKLLSAEGSAKAVWKLPKKQLLKSYGIGQKTVADIGNDEHLRFAEKEIEFCEKHNIKIFLNQQHELPFLLGECEDAPSILYAKGHIPNDKTPISIVGTRNMTAYGGHFIDDFLENVKARNIATVSGLALGADAEVHQKSLEKNIPTIAVLAHGFHTLYPSKNRRLSEEILQNGGLLLTEFNTSQKPDRENFIQRNRVIAGLSKATIVVETAFGGGSVSTVTFANQYNRDVYALPGKITDKYSQGCNHLIFNNKAAAISTIQDLLSDLKLKGSPEQEELFPKSEVKLVLDGDEAAVYEAVKQNPQINLDELSEKLETPSYKILPIILNLELKGHLKSFSGRQFSVI